MSKLFRVQIVRYTLNGSSRTPDGQRVTSKTPGARREASKSSKWYGWVDGERKALSENKEAATKALRNHQGKADYRDSLSEPQRRELDAAPMLECELVSHLAEYRQHLEAKGNSPGYVEKTITRCETIIEECGFKTWGDIDEDAIMTYLLDRRKKEPRFGTSTSNHYITSIKGFTRRTVTKCRKKNIVLSDPLYGMKKLDAQADLRRQRRALDPDQFVRLIEETRKGAVARGLTGQDREVLYTVAAYTGLRASELASLTPKSFNLGEEPTVTVAAGYTKNGKTALLPLQADVAAMVKAFVASKPKDAPLWPGKADAPFESWHLHAADMLRKDLAAAEIAFTDDAGRVFDFHALRGQFITNLARAGVELAVAQKLARHCTPVLTANVYTHLRLHDQAAAVAKLPGLGEKRVVVALSVAKAPADTVGNQCTRKPRSQKRPQVLKMERVGT